MTAVAASYQLHQALEDVTIPTSWTSNDSTSSSVSVTNPAVDPATGVGSTMTTPSSQVEESNTTSIPTSTVSTPNTTSVPAEEGISLNTTTTPTTENPFPNTLEQAEEERNLPLYGEPNASELLWKGGEIYQGRTRDENGNPTRDRDFTETFRRSRCPVKAPGSLPLITQNNTEN